MILQALSMLILELFQRGFTRSDLGLLLKFFDGLKALPICLQLGWILGTVVIFLLYKDYVTAWEAQRLGMAAQVKPIRVLLRGFAVGFALAFLVASLSLEAGCGGFLIFLIMSRRYNWAIFIIFILLGLFTFSHFAKEVEPNKAWFSL